jgi:hypothetical protein
MRTELLPALLPYVCQLPTCKMGTGAFQKCLTTAAAAAVAAAGVCQVSTCKMGTGAFQECPTEAIYSPITKGAYTVTAAEKVGRQYAGCKTHESQQSCTYSQSVLA